MISLNLMKVRVVPPIITLVWVLVFLIEAIFDAKPIEQDIKISKKSDRSHPPIILLVKQESHHDECCSSLALLALGSAP